MKTLVKATSHSVTQVQTEAYTSFEYVSQTGTNRSTSDIEGYEVLPTRRLPEIPTKQALDDVNAGDNNNDDDDDDDDDGLYERIYDAKPSDLSSPTAPLEENPDDVLYDYVDPAMAIEYDISPCEGADRAQLEDDPYESVDPTPCPQSIVEDEELYDDASFAQFPTPKVQPQKPADSKFSRSTILPSIAPQPPPGVKEEDLYDDIPSIPSKMIALPKVSKVQTETPTDDEFSRLTILPSMVPPPTPPPVIPPPTPPPVIPPPTPPDVKDTQPPEASCTDGYEDMDYGESDDDGIYEQLPPVARQEDSSDGSDKEPTIDPDEYTYIDGASGKLRADAEKKQRSHALPASLQRSLSVDYIRNRVGSTSEPANDQMQMLVEQMQEMREMLVQMQGIYISSQAPPEAEKSATQPTPLVPKKDVTRPTYRSLSDNGASISCRDDKDNPAFDSSQTTCEDQKVQAAHQMKKVFSK
jgi:hypothetical protein